ncbi:MAG TPA: PDZ domain-containing protein [Burkholderiales bacterium]|nr:PDZ domain-containing protein [Burkholderiales bacterium]
MKKLMFVCLLTLSAAALAQAPPANPTGTAPRSGKNSEVADLERDTAKLEADEAKTRAQLAEARERLDKAAREVAELSMQLGGGAAGQRVFIERGGPRRAMLGVQVDNGKDGARVISVSPGGPAAEAGLKENDVIVALDGKTIGGANAGRMVVEQMRNVAPDQKVGVVVLRNGKKHDYVIVARPFAFDGNRAFHMQFPDGGSMGGIGVMPMVHQFRTFWQGEFDGMELASLTPKLGAYFGTSTGVLVVQAPQNESFKLEEGDVIQAIDGRKPDDGAHALRILRSYKPGEKLNLSVLRQRKSLTLGVTMPDHPVPMEGPMDNFQMAVPPLPPLPSTAPAPGVPGGAGADT